jgi:hypothetical protein
MTMTTPPVRHGPFGLAFAKVMSALRGDKYMVDAYPKAAPVDPAGPDDAGGPPV